MMSVVEKKEKVLAAMKDDPFECIDDVRCAEVIKNAFPDAYVHTFTGSYIGCMNEPVRTHTIIVKEKSLELHGSGDSFAEAVADMFASHQRRIESLETELRCLRGAENAA